MKVNIEPGKYIVAVSGGVDSMVLLDLLYTNYQPPTTNYQFVVAHFDHGIREDSASDAAFVKKAAQEYELPFQDRRVELGKSASEELARKERYGFLEALRKEQNASAIITAHHQDDVIETMMINMLRGTNRKGLSSLKSTVTLLRPLLEYPKSAILKYAQENAITWREDSTNQNEAYLRNFVRNRIVTGLEAEKRAAWFRIYEKMLKINKELDQEIAKLLQNESYVERAWLLQFPNKVACEIIAELLRRHGAQPSRRQVQDAVTACKVARPNTIHEVSKTVQFKIDNHGCKLTAQ